MTEEIKAKRTVNRSASYPGISLEEAVEATKLLRSNLGAGPYSRESAAQALGYAGVNGASGTKVAACVHFGLLTREGNVYKQSELAQKVFVSVSDSEKQEALRTAVQKPALYAKLIGAYNGSALPNMMSNILTRSYSITERVAKDAATTFIKSVEYAGILKNGVLSIGENPDEDTMPIRTNETAAAVESNNAAFTNPASLNPGVQQDYVPVEIPDTEIKILFPSRYAYQLSTGLFKSGIEELANNAKDMKPETDND